MATKKRRAGRNSSPTCRCGGLLAHGLLITAVCALMLACVSCSPAAETDTPDTEPLPQEEPVSAFEMLSRAAERSRQVGGIAYTEVMGFEYPELSVSSDLIKNRVTCSWNEAEAGTYREAILIPGTEMYYESAEQDTDALLAAFGVERDGEPEKFGFQVYFAEGTLCARVTGGEGAGSWKTGPSDHEGELARLLGSEDREDGPLYVYDPSEVLDNCHSCGEGVDVILKSTDAVPDEKGGLHCEITIPADMISDNGIIISQYHELSEEGSGIELKGIVLSFWTTPEGFLSEQSQKTRFSINLIGEAYTEMIVTSKVVYEAPGAKPRVTSVESDGFRECGPEELLSRIIFANKAETSQP